MCVLKLIVAVSVYCSYPILMNVLVLEVEEALGIVPPDATVDLQEASDGGSRWWYLAKRTLLRSVCVFLTAIAANSIPNFSTFMGLVGSLGVCGVVFVLPVACDWRLRKIRGEAVEPWRWIVGGMIVTVGSVVACVGAYQTLKGL